MSDHVQTSSKQLLKSSCTWRISPRNTLSWRLDFYISSISGQVLQAEASDFLKKIHKRLSHQGRRCRKKGTAGVSVIFMNLSVTMLQQEMFIFIIEINRPKQTGSHLWCWLKTSIIKDSLCVRKSCKRKKKLLQRVTDAFCWYNYVALYNFSSVTCCGLSHCHHCTYWFEKLSLTSLELLLT